MAFKLIAVFSFLAVASAGLLPAYQEYQSGPQLVSSTQPGYGKAEEPYDHQAKYEFAYAVHDEHTGDIKSQTESRDGDLVKGEYSLIDSDGHKRTVQYTADHDHGFNAIVHREPVDLKSIAPALLVKSEYAAAPAYQYAHAPVHVATPAHSI